MSVLDLYFSPPSPPLFGRHGSKQDKVVVFGVPFDGAATRTPGQRFAPRRIREVSVELETFSVKLDKYVEELDFYDAGDLPVLTDFSAMRGLVSKTVGELLERGALPLMLGGDHLASFPVIREVSQHVDELLVLVFDAHMDLRDEYPVSTRFSHATVMRRLLEETQNISIAYFKPRAFSREEYVFARKSGRVHLIENEDKLKELLDSYRNVYISLDIDAVDPAFAPGTGTPEPMGLTPWEVSQALHLIPIRARAIVGFDLVEVDPLVDCNDVTSLLAAKLIMEFLFAYADSGKL
mgnify:CR=1 FL=1